MKTWHRTFLSIKCQNPKCKFRFRVKSEKVVKCHNCEVEGWHCHHCGHRFVPNPKHWCPLCKKFICRNCGACECGIKFRKTIVLHCDNCNKNSSLRLKQPIKCPKCGFDTWKCWVCKEWQPYEKMCLSCGWFVCKFCCSCRVRKHA